MGEGPPVPEAAAAGLQPRGDHVREAAATRRDSRGAGPAARTQEAGVPGLRTRGASPLPDSPRLPAKPSILRGTRRARGSAGRALHSAR